MLYRPLLILLTEHPLIMSDSSPSATIEVATKRVIKDGKAAARYFKYVSRRKAREDFEHGILAKETLLPESADPTSIRTGMKWPQIPLDMAAEVSSGYMISFRKDIKP